MKYTQIPTDTFQHLQLNAGILVSEFTPSTGAIGDGALIGATTGGIQFQDSISFTDFGDDIDNCPKNMKELKILENHEVTMSGTFVTVSADTAKLLAGAADKTAGTSGAPDKITPRNDLKDADFDDIWWIGDYSAVNEDSGSGSSATTAGFIAIHLMNALNTGGFQIQSTDREKGQFSFEFMGHYSMAAQDTVPYEIYIKEGTASA